MREKLKDNIFLILILTVAFLIRLLNLYYPPFSSEEARLAHRGYALAVSGKDELGRSYPLIFNSESDYKLPVTSYITALGVFLFGKNDFGVRIPFIILSILIIIVIYKTSKILSTKKELSLLAALVAAFTPAFISFAKVPNESILLAFGFVLLFYILIQEKIKLLRLFLVMIFVLATSKIAWLISVPFVLITLRFFHVNLKRRLRSIIVAATLFLTAVMIVLFLQIPQATRSFLENDFSILQETSIKVVVERLRGQGIESGWPNFLERILFNKLQIITAAFINWLPLINPAALFGQFDKTNGYAGMGAFPKMAILPFLAGLAFIIQRGELKSKPLIFYYLLFTFPLAFNYPNRNKDIIIVVVPFIIFIIGLGILYSNRLLKYIIIPLIILETLINLFYFSPQIKLINDSRPIWVKKIADEAYGLSMNDRVAISDDFISDIVPFLQWYTPISEKKLPEEELTRFPFKFRQTQVANIKIIGSDNTFYFCAMDKPTYVFASKRDFEEIRRWLNIKVPETMIRVYKDNLGREVVYLLKPIICVN